MLRAASLDIELDLLPLSRQLSQEGISHRINEDGSQQSIWVASEAEVERVQSLLSTLQLFPRSASLSGVLASPSQISSALAKSLHFCTRLFSVSPVSCTLALVCVGVALLSNFGYRLQPVSFLFFPAAPSDSLPAFLDYLFIERGAGLAAILQTFTPMFLHFGLLHISFNLMWLLYFGVQLESRYSSWLMFAVVAVSSFCGNVFQFLYEESRSFGGMSGVVYGLIGFCFILKVLVKDSKLGINNAMFAFFVLSLILMEVFASSIIASAAHLGGLVSGLLLGVVVGLGLQRLSDHSLR